MKLKNGKQKKMKEFDKKKQPACFHSSLMLFNEENINGWTN